MIRQALLMGWDLSLLVAPDAGALTSSLLQDLLAKLHIKTRKKHDFTILSDLSGTIPPGRICLLLGPPGSGKTSLLEALAGKLDGGARKVLLWAQADGTDTDAHAHVNSGTLRPLGAGRSRSTRKQ